MPKLNMPRSFYIPKGAVKVASKSCAAIAYIYASKSGKPGALLFYGRADKPAWHYLFRSEAERTKRVMSSFEGFAAREASKAEIAAKRKAWVNDYKVGEIVGTCWGYDQTNREYFEIVASKGKTVTLRQIRVSSYATGSMSERVAPLAGDYCGEPFDKRAQERGIKIDQCRTAFRVEFTEPAPGIKVYATADTSSWA